MPSRLHLIGAATVDVDQDPEEVAELLWSHDSSYASLAAKDEPIFVNAAAVAYVERSPSEGEIFN